MMGTGESMYFLPSLFYSERSQPCESYLVPSTPVGNGEWFLSQFITASSFSRILYILVPVSLSFVFWNIIKINTSIVYGR